MPITIHGFTCDTEKVAAGLYEIITERNETAIVAFGMIPADLMEMVTANLKRVIAEKIAADYGLPFEEAARWVDPEKEREIINAFNHQISIDILGQAQKAGALLV